MSAPHDTAWMLIASLLTLLLAFALVVSNTALVRSKHAVGMAMFGLGAIGAASITWVVAGYSLAFAPGRPSGLVGDFSLVGLGGAGQGTPVAAALFTLAAAAVAAVALTGVAADRMRFGAMLVFLLLWSLAVYPVAVHWTRSEGGWLREWGALDHAGGLTIGVCVGASAWALALVLGPRRKWRKRRVSPHNRPLALAATGLAWVGWMGMVAGASGRADASAASALLAVHLSAVGGMGGWVLIEKRLVERPTSVGALSGALAGLVASTASAAYLNPFAGLVTGLVAGVVCQAAIRLKYRWRYDDALDVVAVHLYGGAVGALMVGVFGRVVGQDGVAGIGWAVGGGAGLLGRQAVAVLAVAAFSFAATVVAAWAVRASRGLRVTPEEEDMGLDESQHGEAAYEIRH